MCFPQADILTFEALSSAVGHQDVVMLVNAARKREDHVLHRLLAATDGWGNTVLHVAAAGGRLHLVRWVNDFSFIPCVRYAFLKTLNCLEDKTTDKSFLSICVLRESGRSFLTLFPNTSPFRSGRYNLLQFRVISDSLKVYVAPLYASRFLLSIMEPCAATARNIFNQSALDLAATGGFQLVVKALSAHETSANDSCRCRNDSVLPSKAKKSTLADDASVSISPRESPERELESGKYDPERLFPVMQATHLHNFAIHFLTWRKCAT